MQQEIGTTRLPDGTAVAYAVVGTGPPLLVIGGWLSHLELSWALPAERRFLEGLAHGRTVIRYDRPGCGISDRSSQECNGVDAEMDTVAAVLRATGTERADLLGASLGVPLAVEWAARHAETVDRLILYGGWADGSAIAPPEIQEHVLGLIRAHWGLGADVLTDLFAPDASAGTRTALASYQRGSSSAATAAALLELCYRVDVTELLPKVGCPTLVLHREQDRAAPIEQARLIAAGIPGAELVVLPGRSHLPYVGDSDVLVAAVRRFLGLRETRRMAAPDLTRRQREVAALISEGLTNREIGVRLGIEERSAEGHVERIRLRLGVRSRAQIAAWWVASNP